MKRLIKILCGWLFILVYSANVYAQPDSLVELLPRIQRPVSSFSVGNIGELYVIDLNNQLKKYDENGDSVGVFNQVAQFGKLDYVEAQNPWKVVLFYRNLSTIVLLDKYLKMVSQINLRNKNIFGVQAVTTSYDNNLWLYDEQENKLKKVDDAGNLLFESVDFRLLFDEVPSPQRIVDRDGYVYLYDAQQGLYQFDYYGSFKQLYRFTGWKAFAVSGKNIVGIDDTQLYRLGPSLPAQQTALPAALQYSNGMQLANEKLYVLKDHFLRIYHLRK